MNIVKVLSDYNYSNGYHCPCCGNLLTDFVPVQFGKKKNIPMIRFEQFEATCSGCDSVIEYMYMVKR